MYSTCLFCHASLGANAEIESFPVGRRLAYDSAKGRLWAVCPKCARWNLTPLEERWEAIEECERHFRRTRARIQTDNIGLAKLKEGLELVRIGQPRRPEFAAWRYGRQFEMRRRRAMAVAGASAVAGGVAAVAAAPIAGPVLLAGLIFLTIVPGLTSLASAPVLFPIIAARDWLEWERVIARIPAPDGRALTVRVRHMHGSRLISDQATGELLLDVDHDGGTEHFRGAAALTSAARLLARANRIGAAADDVRGAVRQIDFAGDAERYLHRAAHLSNVRRGGVASLLRDYRKIDTLNLSSIERLALEMAVHEEGERRVMEGELKLLELAWKEAEEIAAIADTL